MAKTKSVRPPFVVGGVDTHKDLHVAAVVDENNRVLGSDFFATTRQGYRQMLTWMASFGTVARIGLNVPVLTALACYATCKMPASPCWK
jgi:hypothetical protein